MMARTDRHFRYLIRLIAPGVGLYSEMVTANAVLHGDRARLLAFDPAEHPVALQLGGGELRALAAAAAIGEAAGYDEINLNVGCPSPRVREGAFGAALMAEPARVAACAAAMKAAVAVPVTVKCRVGIDDRDRYEDLLGFAETVAAAGADGLIVHARKAWLSGLSPAENRTLPPLRHDRVHRLRRDPAPLPVVLNGGIATPEAAVAHLARVDGVMIGRAAYATPMLLAEIAARVLGPAGLRRDPLAVIDSYLMYVRRCLAEGVPLATLARPVLGLFARIPGARGWRRHLAENAHRPGAGAGVIEDALALVTASA